MSTSTSISTSTGVQWTETQHVSLTLWDIENEFQQAQKAYEQWQARNRYAHPLWTRFGIRNKDLTLKRALNLGRQVQTLMENGKQRFGARFEQGDCKWHRRHEWLMLIVCQRNATSFSPRSFCGYNMKFGNRCMTVHFLRRPLPYPMKRSSRLSEAFAARVCWLCVSNTRVSSHRPPRPSFHRPASRSSSVHLPTSFGMTGKTQVPAPP